MESHSVTKAGAMKGELNELPIIFPLCSVSFLYLPNGILLFLSEIKERMEMDVDEVGKLALRVKKALEDLDRDVSYLPN